MSDAITEATLRELLDSGAVRAVTIVAQGNAWAVQVEVGTRWRVLRSARDDVRWWKSLDRLARWLHGLGISEWSVDARQFAPQQRSVA
ncbi:hypothetical protein [Thioalkalivibrio halophilus]|uniref:Uncharacterized protein n=1 Tax=Thioalkalivibrio halophilus TaxID=252474 RepID=A0A1V2ZUR4_9GAMM|nr:hypothetical protein [Thioalkalivibrio halophilus]OOC08864.1 hypothetical protein B1A74_14005 [Thioalkalivibrio halophilus]